MNELGVYKYSVLTILNTRSQSSVAYMRDFKQEQTEKKEKTSGEVNGNKNHIFRKL